MWTRERERERRPKASGTVVPRREHRVARAAAGGRHAPTLPLMTDDFASPVFVLRVDCRVSNMCTYRITPKVP